MASLKIVAIAFCLSWSAQLMARPLVVAFGGFGSCAVAGYTSEMKASNFIDELAESLDADLIKTCFALSSQTVFAENIDHDESFRGPISDLFGFIEQAAQGPVYLVGQSYGGWVAMQAALQISPKIQVLGLATIDPISMKTCAPSNFAGSILLGSDPGCTQAPRDLERNFSRIKDRVGHWYHFYQTEYSNLHSSDIPTATTSSMVQYGESWHPFGAHALTETDERIWQDIQHQFLRSVD